MMKKEKGAVPEMTREEKGAVQKMTREEAIYQLIVPTVVCL